MNFTLNEENFIMFAIKHYDNPHCKGIEEFNDDLKRFRYLKRLLRKYDSSKNLRERLILNHIIVLYNLFGIPATTAMLFYKIEKKFWPQLKTFLVYLDLMPDIITINNDTIRSSNIIIDENVADSLRKILCHNH